MKIAPVACARLAIGLVQGLVLYGLFNAADHNLWPATHALIFAPATLVFFIVPLLLIIASGSMRLRSLLIWGVLSVVTLTLLALYDVMRRGDQDSSGIWQHAQILPSLSLTLVSMVGLFIAQTLVMSGDSERKIRASYPSYFDIGWKLAVQLNFSLIFVSMFWGVLWLGAAMFLMLKVHAVSNLLGHRWFSIPATAVSFAYAIHLTDVRMNLVRAIRTIKLTMMAWLLPLITFFAAGFLLTVPIQGGELLWKTHHSSQILLAAMSLIILYLNAAYQDGLPEHTPRGILRYAGRIAAALLLPLWGLAIYGVVLRVNEYGWTVNLIHVSACLLVVLCYACGYMWATVTPGLWLKKLEQTNIVTAYVILVVLVALFSPFADPARLAVASQLARLDSGAISADKFDYGYLSREGERYGAKALHQLHDGAQGPDALALQTKIDQAIMLRQQAPQALKVHPPSSTDLAANIKVYPEGQSLPESFLKQDWSEKDKTRTRFPPCLSFNTIRCEAFLFGSSGNAGDHILLTSEGLFGNSQLFELSDKGEWNAVGALSNMVNCKSVREAMRAGASKLGVSEVKELQVNDTHIQIQQDEQCSEGIH